MKVGRTLSQVLTQVKSEQKAKRDFLVPTDHLAFTPEGRIDFEAGQKQFEAKPTPHCLRQIATAAGIPAAYVDRMEGKHSPLLAKNINYWWKTEPKKRMLRTLLNGDHKARAFLSERFRPLENSDLAAAILPKLEKLNCEILSCEITETRFYIQAATTKIEAKLVGDRVRAGVVIGNSEVGKGSIFIDPLLYYLRCLNGMIMPRVMQRYHVGGRKDQFAELEEATEYFTDATREMNDRAFWMKVRDVTDAVFEPARFNALVDKFEGATEQKVKGAAAIEEVTERYKFNKEEHDAILQHFIEGGQTNVFGLVNAVTRTATDVESYDRSIELQRIGGAILELPKTVWTQL